MTKQASALVTLIRALSEAEQRDIVQAVSQQLAMPPTKLPKPSRQQEILRLALDINRETQRLHDPEQQFS